MSTSSAARLLALLPLMPISLTACDPKEGGGSDGDEVTDADADGDGSPASEDCDDADPNNFPGNAEVCDEADNNCDGTVDEGVLETFYADSDGDGHGDPEMPVEACAAPSGTVADSADCDDANADVNPDGTEICNGIDDDCDTLVDAEDDSVSDLQAFYTDSDADGYGDPAAETLACEQPDGTVTNAEDCDDGDDSVNPDTPWYADSDADGYGDPAAETLACEQPDGTVSNAEDCDDGDDSVNPDTVWYSDSDGDGFGDPDVSVIQCEAPAQSVRDATDCDDTDDTVNPGGVEICNGVDDDCDATTLENGMVSWQDSTGAISDVSGDFTGSASTPAAYTASSDGTLWFCDGTHYANITLAADVTVAGLSGDSSLVTLDGAATSAVVATNGDGLSVAINDVTLTNGAGDASVLGSNSGGGVLCQGSSSGNSISLDGTLVTANDATFGGGLMTYLCDVTVVDSDFTDNTSDYGGGLLMFGGGTHSLTDSAITGNYASINIGGLYHNAGTLDLDDVLVSDNSAVGNGGGAVYEGGAAVTHVGTSTTESGYTGNDCGSEGGGVFLGDATFTATSVDFGTDSGGDDNDPMDIWVDLSGFEYTAGDDATFTCSASSCGTSTDHTVGGTSVDFGNTNFWGNAFTADSFATVDSFEVWTTASSTCSELDYFMLESSDGGSTWDVVWSAFRVSAAAAAYNDSSAIGVSVIDGYDYILAFAGTGCSPQYQWTRTSSGADAGFGYGTGYVGGSTYSRGDYNTGDSTTGLAVDSAYGGEIWNMVVNVTEL